MKLDARLRSIAAWSVMLLSPVVHAEDWQRKAVEMYPELGVSGSALNRKFAALYQERMKADAAFFKNPQWPVLLARECADQLAPPAASQPSATAQKIYVSPTGNDQNTGDSLERALKTPAAAVSKAEPGTAVYFDAGTYFPLKIVGKKGTDAKPIVFECVAGKEGQVNFTSNRLEAGIAISMENCAYVTVRDLHATNSLKGIDVYSCSNCAVEHNSISNLGQEAIHVGRAHSSDALETFSGPASEYVQVLGNTIEGTGKLKPEFGEGIYIGTGAFRGDETHHVLIANNTLTDIAAEGVELKPGTHDVIVRGNRISNTHHEYNAAITVSIEGNDQGDGNFLIENNLIWNIKKLKYSVAGICVGHGKTIIRNNIIWSVEGGTGITVNEKFANPKWVSVLIENNTVWCEPGGKTLMLHTERPDSPNSFKAKVEVRHTYTADGSSESRAARPTMFVGPLTGTADAGKGPGSGFQLKTSGPTGADYAKVSASSNVAPR